MANKKNQTDTIIMGGGLAGLITAAFLERAGQNYLLFEAMDEFGGLARGQNYQGVWLDYGLKSIPVGDIDANPLLKLKKDLNLKFNIETVLEPPLSHSKSGFTTFVGFGEAGDKKALHELSYYVEAPRVLVSNGWKTLIDELLTIIPEEKRKRKSHITKIEMVDEKIQSVTINGADLYTAENFVFTLSPALLLGLLPAGSFSPKATQKLSKAEALTAVSLDLATTKRMSELKSTLVLSDDNLTVIGQFISNSDPLKQSEGLQISSWLSLVDSDTSKDDEQVSKTLKNMKKLIKKAFPELVDSAHWERILVAPHSHGGNLNLAQQIVNFYLVGSQYAEKTPYLSSVISGALKTSAEITARQAGITEKTMFEDLGL